MADDVFRVYVKISLGSLLLASIGMVYTVYLTTCHEQKFWVSSRTDIDGEITFQGEGAFYYSFYKDLLRAPTHKRGLIELVYNNKTIPFKTINAMKMLTLYPEVIISGLLEFVGRHGVDPVYFYLGMVFALQGMYFSALFATSWIMSGTWLAGVLATGWFIIHRTDTALLEESVPLRENWALPYFALQVAALTGYLRHNSDLSVERFCNVLMCVSTHILMMAWEYSHYLLFVQALSLCLLDGLSLICKEKVHNICQTYLTTVCLGYLFQFEKPAMLTSPLLSLVIAAMAAKGIQSGVDYSPFQDSPFQANVMAVLCFCFPFSLAQQVYLFFRYLVGCTGNYPILQALKVKFGMTMTKNFTVNWLLCWKSFQSLSQDCLWRLTKSTLLYFYIVVLIICLISMAQGLLKRFRGDPVSEITREEGRVGERPEVIYHVVQSLILGLLAMKFEGLKYLWTPYVCVLAAFGVCSPALWTTLFKLLRLRDVNTAKLAFLLSLIIPALLGSRLWREFLPRTAELSEPEKHYESDTMLIMNWIKGEAPVTAVFAASPQLMGDIKLCTGRMVTSLPVYTNEELTRRNERMYQIYSMKSAEEIYNMLTFYKANYIVIEESICNEMVRMDKCGVKDLLDIANDHLVTEGGNVHTARRHRRFCQELKLNHSPLVTYFTRVYWNRSYYIYKINSVVTFQS